MISVGDAVREVGRVQKRAHANETVSVRPIRVAKRITRDDRASMDDVKVDDMMGGC